MRSLKQIKPYTTRNTTVATNGLAVPFSLRVWSYRSNRSVGVQSSRKLPAPHRPDRLDVAGCLDSTLSHVYRIGWAVVVHSSWHNKSLTNMMFRRGNLWFMLRILMNCRSSFVEWWRIEERRAVLVGVINNLSKASLAFAEFVKNWLSRAYFRVQCCSSYRRWKVKYEATIPHCEHTNTLTPSAIFSWSRSRSGPKLADEACLLCYKKRATVWRTHQSSAVAAVPLETVPTPNSPHPDVASFL